MAGRALRIALIVILTSAVAPGLASAKIGAAIANTGNTIAAATLQPPGVPQSTHPSGTAGTVNLSWSASGSGFVTGYQVRRATAPGGPFSTTVCSGAGRSCTDTGAAYNGQYYYRAVATFNNWTAQSGTAMALSLAPTAGSDTTTTVYTFNAGDIADLALPDASVFAGTGYYTTNAAWASGGFQANRYLEFRYSPVVAAGAPVSRVRVTLIYGISVANSAATFRLQVSPDGGATWTNFTLPNPGAALTAYTTTVDITSVAGTPGAVQNLRLRFQAAAQTGATFLSGHDIVHVDVN